MVLLYPIGYVEIEKSDGVVEQCKEDESIINILQIGRPRDVVL